MGDCTLKSEWLIPFGLLRWHPSLFWLEQMYYRQSDGIIRFSLFGFQGWGMDVATCPYRNRSMRKGQTAKALSEKTFKEEAEWDHLEYGTLKKSRSACVCITCQHFNYCCDKHCRTLLTCHVQQRLIPHGEHLTSRCPLWQRRLEKDIGWCPEAA